MFGAKLDELTISLVDATLAVKLGLMAGLNAEHAQKCWPFRTPTRNTGLRSSFSLTFLNICKVLHHET